MSTININLTREQVRRLHRVVYSGPQKVDHSGHLHLLRLSPSQPLLNPGPMDLARGPVTE